MPPVAHPFLVLARLGRFRNALLLRGLGVWAFGRLGLVAARVPDPHIVQELLLLCVVATAVLLDARRRREDLFLGNLGAGPLALATWALPLATLAELIVP